MVNDKIKANSIMLIHNGQSTVMSLNEALKIAKENNLDLVQISNKELPVCKLCIYEKYLYEKRKRQKDNLKKQKKAQLGFKEIKMHSGTQLNDLKVKARKIDKLLKYNNKVKVTIEFRGRELKYITDGIEMLNNFERLVQFNHKVEQIPIIYNKQVYMVLVP